MDRLFLLNILVRLMRFKFHMICSFNKRMEDWGSCVRISRVRLEHMFQEIYQFLIFIDKILVERLRRPMKVTGVTCLVKLAGIARSITTNRI